MGRRGDHIHKRKDGRWEGRYCIERRNDGKIRYGSVYGRTHKEVKDKLASITPGDVTAGSQGLTFEHLARLWLDSNRIRLKGSTIQKYEFLLNTHILPELGKTRLSQLTSGKINTYLSQKAEHGRKNRKGNLSASYIRTITIILKSVLHYGVQEKLCAPLNTEIHQPQETKKELHILSKEDQQKLEKHLMAVITPVNAGIMLSLHAGLRIGEVCALKWNDVDLKEKIIHIRSTVSRVGKNDGTHGTKLIIGTPKTKASLRDVPVSSVLFRVLSELKSTSDSPYVISESDTFTSPRTFDYRYHRILKQCDISPINYHALRHTFATRCIEAKMDVSGYHRKVIDQNNATKQTIEKIFEKVKATDASYSGQLFAKLCSLESETTYIKGLSDIVSPHKGKNIIVDDFVNKATVLLNDVYGVENTKSEALFYYALTGDLKSGFTLATGADNAKTVCASMVLSGHTSWITDDSDLGDIITNNLGTLQKISKISGETISSATIISTPILNYLLKLLGVVEKTTEGEVDITPEFLSLLKASIDVETGVFKYHTKKADLFDSIKIDEKYGGAMTGLSILAKTVDFSKDLYESVKLYSDEYSKNYDKAASSIKLVGSFAKTIGEIYIAAKSKNKILQIIPKTSEGVNQILVDSLEVKYAIPPSVKTTTENVSTALAVVDVAANTTAATIKRIGQVAEDGEIDGVERCSIAVYGSLGGLKSVTEGLTLGIVSFDSEEVAADLESGVTTFLNDQSWASKYVQDMNNPSAFRFLVSMGVATDMVAKKAVDIVVDTGKTICSWVQKGVDFGKNLIEDISR